MTWATAESEWNAFLESVRLARRRLHCSNSGAWFRGLSDRRYSVIPSLFRGALHADSEFERDRLHSERDIAAFRPRYAQCKQKLLLLAASRAYGDVLSDEERVVRQEMRELRTSKDNALADLRRHTLVPSGERDAYVEWCFRSGKTNEPSWAILAEMQHSGLPTRLLDWSESLLVSLFFATKKYSDAVQQTCRQLGTSLESINGDPSRLSDAFASMEGAPAIWILNPYIASERATNRTRIWDLSRDHYDYYEAFVHRREWPFERAVPAFSPWSSSRIAAQQGLFTVWGHDRRPLNQQFGANCVAQVTLPPAAALYAVRHFRELGGLDHFSMYRDLDSLASGLKHKFFDR